MLTLSGPLTQREAPRVLREGEAQLGQARQAGNGAVQVDCAGLSQVDSSALAVLLSWQRTAQAAGLALNIAGAPEALCNLAKLYGAGPHRIPSPGATLRRRPVRGCDPRHRDAAPRPSAAARSQAAPPCLPCSSPIILGLSLCRHRKGCPGRADRVDRRP
jgi:phospholipid transport system transporter-binding protein